MDYWTEQKIKQAICHGDDEALAEAVGAAARWGTYYDDIERAVEDAGGYRYLRHGKIEMGNTIIRDHFGRARVEERY